MDMESVSNELILEFLRDFKSDVNRRFSEIDKRFEQVDKRFEQVDKRFEQITADMNARFEQVDKRFEQMHREIAEVKELGLQNKQDIEELKVHRNEISVKFTRSWALASLCIALLSSTIVLAVDKAF